MTIPRVFDKKAILEVKFSKSQKVLLMALWVSKENGQLGEKIRGEWTKAPKIRGYKNQT